MKIFVDRHSPRETYTIGKMYIDGVPFCDTLEDKIRDLSKESKVYGETAIGEGTYEVSLEYSQHFRRELPYLHNVSQFSGILIHAGNSASDTKGCILVGENKQKGKLINSRGWEEVLVRRVREAIAKDNKVFITLHNR